MMRCPLIGGARPAGVKKRGGRCALQTMGGRRLTRSLLQLAIFVARRKHDQASVARKRAQLDVEPGPVVMREGDADLGPARAALAGRRLVFLDCENVQGCGRVQCRHEASGSMTVRMMGAESSDRCWPLRCAQRVQTHRNAALSALLASFAALSLLVSTGAHAWGAPGHETVAA